MIVVPSRVIKKFVSKYVSYYLTCPIMFHEAFLAGVWASIGSTLGKLSGTPVVVGNSYVIWISLLAVMVLSNTWGCRYYLRSLDAATNSVVPTVISAASSYILSGIIGVIVFSEGASVRWWLGVFFIVVGLVLVARPREYNEDKWKN